MEPTKILTWKSVKRIQKLQVVGHHEPILPQCEPCLGEQIKTPSIELCHNLAKSTELGRWNHHFWIHHLPSLGIPWNPTAFQDPRSVTKNAASRLGDLMARRKDASTIGVRIGLRRRRWVGATDQRLRGTSLRAVVGAPSIVNGLYHIKTPPQLHQVPSCWKSI